MTHEEFINAIKGMSVIELMDLVKVREVVSGLGLKEAKEFVEAAPKTIKEAVSKDEAKKIVDQFAAVGAKCEIK